MLATNASNPPVMRAGKATERRVAGEDAGMAQGSVTKERTRVRRMTLAVNECFRNPARSWALAL